MLYSNRNFVLLAFNSEVANNELALFEQFQLESQLVKMGFMEFGRILNCGEAAETGVNDGSVVFVSLSCLSEFRV